MSKEIELKPCPFCGGEAYYKEWQAYKSVEAKLGCTNTNKNKCFMQPLSTNNGSHREKDRIVKTWNKRTEATSG